MMSRDVRKMTEIELQYVIFLENDFITGCEINEDFRLYEMEDLEVSGSAIHIDLAPIEQDSMGYHAPPEVGKT